MSGRSFLSILTSIALSFGFGSLNANAQTTGICRQVSEIIEHPAIYVVDTFTRKIKTAGVSCVLHSSCCLPGWELDPFCYVEETVTNRRMTAAPWQETKSKITCEDFPPDEALKRILASSFLPTRGIFTKVTGLDSIISSIRPLVSVAKAAAEPLPQDLRREIENAYAPLTRSKRGGEPFYREGGFPENGTARAAVNEALWIRYDDPAGAPLWAFVSSNPDIKAVTFDNVIVAGPDLLAMTGCGRVARWAHEVAHVNQYKVNGFSYFTTQYLGDGANFGYCGIYYELTAIDFENQIRHNCSLAPVNCT